MPASMENGAAALRDVPSFVSARAANTIISEDRPTRIQAETLLVLNGLLDELLLLILASARSLATDRIKSDGMLKIFSNNLLAKDAVLEAELELRSYVDGKRAEGAKVPLGLMATSRLDGTDEFPVQSAFKALRLRCQFYSTLADCDDEGLAKDQNIMSTDGRPIATVTQGVAIYVTALLEFVGQHVLQNVSRVIERDNSDEASLYDLRAAITEDEQLNPLYNKMAIKQELARRIDILEARRRKLTEDGARSGVRSDARVVKPWHVPTGGDFDEAAGPTLFSAKRASVQQTSMRSDQTSTATSSRYGHAASSSLGHADSSSLRASTSTLRTSSSIANHNALESPSLVSSGGGASAQSDSRSSPVRNVSGSTPRSEANTGSIGRRQSSDRSWSGMFGSMKRRGSFKQGSDPNGTAGRPLLQPDAASLQASQSSSALDPDDDFEALMLSGQTMKVSLTPNRLHTIEVAKKGDDANLAPVRRRPGTAGLRDESAPASAFGQAPSPSATLSSQMSDAQSGTANGAADRTSIGVVPSETSFPRPSSRASLQTAVRPERRAAAPPPSSYRSPSPALIGKTNLLARDVMEEDAALPVQMSAAAPRRSGLRLQPRDDETERGSSNAKDLVDLFRSTPPSATSERFGNFGSDTASLNDGSSRKSAMGDRVRTLFGRKSTSSSGHGTPASPQQMTQRAIARGDTKPSLEGSQDTYVTSSTNNSMEQSRSLFSPNEAPFNRSAASRSSTSTSEHPTASADAAPDSKVTPDVTVVEPETDSPNGTNGLGIGSAAAAAAAAATAGTAGIMAARSASHGSRSTSHASQTPSMTEGTIHDDTIADDASATSKTKATEELVSRKVPWGYKRNSTNAGSLIERSGTPLSDRRRSIGYQSSNGHGVLPVRGASSAALSDNGHGAGGATVPTTPIASTADEQGAAASASSAVRSANAPSAWSGSIAPASSQTRTRRSSFGARPSTANQARRPSAHLETIQLLAELERAMRNCHSVDECRALVQKAMHSDGTPLSPSASGLSAASGGHEANGDRKLEASDTAAGAVAPSADQSNVAPNMMSGGKTSSREAGHGAEPRHSGSGADITSLEQAEQGLVVAWLLGGDDDPEPRRDSKGAERVVRESITSSGSGLTNGEADETVVRNFSLDSTASGKDVANLASSSVVSLQSNYKDAQDEVAAE